MGTAKPNHCLVCHVLCLPLDCRNLRQDWAPCRYHCRWEGSICFDSCRRQGCDSHDHDLLRLVSHLPSINSSSKIAANKRLFSWSFGLNGIPWIVSAEIFPGALRNLTGTWAALVQWYVIPVYSRVCIAANTVAQAHPIHHHEGLALYLQVFWLRNMVLLCLLDDSCLHLGLYFLA